MLLLTRTVDSNETRREQPVQELNERLRLQPTDASRDRREVVASKHQPPQDWSPKQYAKCHVDQESIH